MKTPSDLEFERLYRLVNNYLDVNQLSSAKKNYIELLKVSETIDRSVYKNEIKILAKRVKDLDNSLVVAEKARKNFALGSVLVVLFAFVVLGVYTGQLNVTGFAGQGTNVSLENISSGNGTLAAISGFVENILEVNGTVEEINVSDTVPINETIANVTETNVTEVNITDGTVEEENITVNITSFSCSWNGIAFEVCETVEWSGGIYAKGLVVGGTPLLQTKAQFSSPFTYCQTLENAGTRALHAYVYDENNKQAASQINKKVKCEISNITETNITEVNITETNVTEVNITETNVTEVNITETNVTEVNITDGTVEEVVQYQAVIGQPVKWKKKVKTNRTANLTIDLPKGAKLLTINKVENNISVDITKEVTEKEGGFLTGFFTIVTGRAILEQSTLTEVVIEQEVEEVEIEYETPGPTIVEESIGAKKIVTINSDIHYENILTYTDVFETKPGSYNLYWLINGSRINHPILNETDADGDGLIDRLYWVTPHLSNQTFEVEVIVITSASHLDANYTFISDIYEKVKEKDGKWSERIYHGDYVRVTFEKPLNNRKDITIFSRNVQSANTKVEVYIANTSIKITEFPYMVSTKYYKVYLNGLEGEHSTFDLRVVSFNRNLNAYLEFDHIIDPSANKPILTKVDINTTDPVKNNTNQNITVYIRNVTDADGDFVTNITNWFRNGTSIAPLNIQFDTNNSNNSQQLRDYSSFNNNGTMGGSMHVEWNMDASGNSFRYEDLTSVGDYAIQSGDVVVYDVYWEEDDSSVGFDYTTSNGTTLRGSGATDQNGFNAHPGTLIGSRATGQWYHRRINITAGHAGLTINNFDIACENDSNTNVVAWFDNIYIENSSGQEVHSIFNGSSFTHANHLSSSGNIVNMSHRGNNSFLFNANGLSGGAYDFDGRNDFVLLNPDSNFNLSFTATDDFSSNVWFKATGNDRMELLQVGSGSIGNWILRLNQDTAGNINAAVTDLTNPQVRASGGSTANNGSWHMGSMNYYGNGTVDVYLDGVKVDTATGTLSGQLWSTSTYVSVGLGINGEFNLPLNGSIDDVKVFNKTLSDEQIRYLYNAGAGAGIWETIVSQETQPLETWSACVTPNDGTQDGNTVCTTQNVTVWVNPPGSIERVDINTTNPANNNTNQDITIYPRNVEDSEGEQVKNITNWFVNGTSITLLHLPFEGGSSGSFTRDYSALSNNGTVNGATFNSTGGYDGFGAYEFDGINDDVDLSSHISEYANLAEGSISVWFNLTNSSRNIVFKFGETATADRLLIEITTSNFTRFLVREASSNVVDLTGSTQVTDGRWHHFVVTMDPLNQGKTYLDGVDITSGTNSYAWFQNVTSAVQMTIGHESRGSDLFYEGSMDEFVIYNRSLTPQQILKLYQNRTDLIVSQETSGGENWSACVTPNDRTSDGEVICSQNLTVNFNSAPIITSVDINSTNPVSNSTNQNITIYPRNVTDVDDDQVKNITDWKLNGASIALLNMPFEGDTNGSNSKDYSGFENNGTVSGPIYNSTGGVDGFGAYEFDGVNDFIDLGNPSSLNLANTNRFTLSAWIYHVGGASVESGVISEDYSRFGSSVDVQYELGLDFDQGTGSSRPAVGFFDGSWHLARELATITDNQWHHLVGTWNGSNLSLFRNGVVVASATSSASLPSGDIDRYFIGQRHDTGGSNPNFNGTIDEVRIYNRSLSVEQIRALYNNGTDLIVSQETSNLEIWSACVTPNDGTQDGNTVCTTQNVTILASVPPTITSLDINSTDPINNNTNQNITIYPRNVSDLDGDQVKNITNWFKNGTSFTVLSMPFEGDTNGSNSKDYSGFENNGTVVGATLNSTGGYDGFGAYNFDGVNDYISLPSSLGVDNTSTTVMAWVNINDTLKNGSFAYIGGGTTDGFGMGVGNGVTLDTNGNIFMLVFSGCCFVSSGTAIGTGWHHVAFTLNSTASPEFFIDGVSVATSTSQARAPSVAGARIGSEAAAIVRHFNGSIDDVMVFNHTLSAEQVLALYQNRTDLIVSQETSGGENWSACVTPNDRTSDGEVICSQNLTVNLNSAPTITSVDINSTDPVSNNTNQNITIYPRTVADVDGDFVTNITEWFINSTSLAIFNMPMDTNLSGSTFIKDYSVTEANGSLSGNTIWSNEQNDRGSGVFEFDGTDDSIDAVIGIPNAGTNASITISAWINPDVNSSLRNVFTKGINGNCFNYGAVVSSGALLFRNTQSDFSFGSGVAINSIATGRWQHIAISTNSTGVTGYINGVNIGVNRNQSTRSCAVNGWTIGLRPGLTTEDYDGKIDGVIIYNRSLSPEQVLALYQNRTDLIVSQETSGGENWSACVTPNDRSVDGSTVCTTTNISVFENNIPTISSIDLNTTNPTVNDTIQNITLGIRSVADVDGDQVKNITDWKLNLSSIALLNVPFEANGGSESSVTRDYSGNGFNGTVDGATFNTTGGVDGKSAYSFDGTARSINITGFYNVTNDFSLTTWIKLDEITNRGIIEKTINQAVNTQWLLFVEGTDVSFRIRNESGTLVTLDSTTIAPNVWYHVAATKNTSGMYLYLNGALNASDVSGGAGSNTRGNDGNLLIGTLGSNVYRFNGIIDDVGIWNRSLSPEQVLALYQNKTDLIISQETQHFENWSACVTPNDGTNDGIDVCSTTNVSILNTEPNLTSVDINSTDPVSNNTNQNITIYPRNVQDLDGDNVNNITNWFVNGNSWTVLNMPFEEESNRSNGNVKDYSPFSNNGTITTGLLNLIYNSSGGYDGFGAYEFNASTTTLLIPNDDSLNLSRMNFSIEARFKAGLSTTTVATILAQSSGSFTADQRGLGAVLYTNGTTLQGMISNFSKNDTVFGTTSIIDGKWHHVVFTVDSTTLSLYLDGLLDNSTARTLLGDQIQYDTGFTTRIGTHAGGTTIWNGTLDEIRVYNRSLSAEQVNTLYINRTDLIVSQEISDGENWSACVTPNDRSVDGSAVCSQNLTVFANKAPTIASIDLNTTNPTVNDTIQNMTLGIRNVADIDGDKVKNITSWYLNGSSFAALNVEFEANGGSESSVTRDYSGNGNNGTVSGPIYNSTGGVDGFGAYEFNEFATTNQINFGNDSTLDTSGKEFTLMAWVKRREFVNHNVINKFGASANNFQGYGLYFSGGNFIAIYRNTSNTFDVSSSNANLIDTWIHVTQVVNSTHNSIYLNASLSAILAVPGGPTTFSSNNFIVGPTNAVRYFNGTLDGLRLYNRSLSPEQIREIYNNETDLIISQETQHFENWSACVTPNDGTNDGIDVCSTTNVSILNTEPNLTSVDINSTDPVSNNTNQNITIYPRNVQDLDGDNVNNITNWFIDGVSWTLLNMPFEGGSNATFTRDYSGTNNSGIHNGTLKNDGIFNDTGGIDGFGAYELDGFNKYIEIASTEALKYRGGNLTLIAWVKPTIGENSSGRIFSKPWNGNGEYNYVLIREQNGKVSVSLRGNSTYTLTAQVNITAEDWFHLAATIDSERNTSIYINGVLNASDTNTVLNWTSQNPDQNRPLAIGTLFPYGTGTGGFRTGFSFNGTVDDVMILNKTLSPEQIRELYNNRTDLIVSQETFGGENWSACVTPNDRSVDGSTVCSQNLTVFANSPPTTPVLQIPPDGNVSINRTPFFNWTASTDVDGDSITYVLNITCIGGCSEDNRYHAGLTNNNFTLSDELKFFGDDGYNYNWTVLAYDGEENSSWATDFSFTINTYVAILLNSTNISFGDMSIGSTNDTTDDSPNPFVLQNEGNVEIDLNLSGTNLWVQSVNPTSDYRYKVDNTSIETNSFNATGSNVSFANVPASDNKFVDSFNHTDSNDTLEVDIEITVPSGEPAGLKSSIITYTAFRS